MTKSIIEGKVWVFGDDIDTDTIAPARYLASADPEDWARHVMEPACPDFHAKVSSGDILVAGRGFGSGSSREHAAIALKTSGVVAVVAESIARVFFRNSINNGLLAIECPGITRLVDTGDVVRINLLHGKVFNILKEQPIEITPMPEFIMAIVASGGLLPYIDTHGLAFGEVGR